MLSSRRCEMMTEKRKNMIRKTPPASRKSVSGESGNPDQVAYRVEQRARPRENQHDSGGQQPAYRILDPNVRPAHADQDHHQQDDTQDRW